MITVEIPKKELLRQLPQGAGYALLQFIDEMPDSFIFQAFPTKTPSEVLEERYPKLYAHLTAMQRKLFVELHGRGKIKIPTLYHTLGITTQNGSVLEPASSDCNAVSVHIKDLRRALATTKTPFKIITHRGSKGHSGAYEMISLNKST